MPQFENVIQSERQLSQSDKNFRQHYFDMFHVDKYPGDSDICIPLLVLLQSYNGSLAGESDSDSDIMYQLIQSERQLIQSDRNFR